MCKEIWLAVKGFEGYYEVSNECKVRSVDRTIKDKNGVIKHLKGVVLKEYNSDEVGHKSVKMFRDGKQYSFLVYRLGMEAFGIPNPNNYPCVNHKDENPLNNLIYINEDGTVDLEKTNLEWCTYQYNNTYGTVKERAAAKMRGRKVPEEIVKKRSDAQRGRKNTPETIEKMRKAKEEAMVPIIAENIKTRETFNFNSEADAARVLKVHRSNILAVLKNKNGRTQTGGYRFFYKNMSK